MVYILKHHDPKFTGIFHGIGFDNGLGSTSSLSDRNTLVKNGCTDITKEHQAKKKKAATKKEAGKKTEAKK